MSEVGKRGLLDENALNPIRVLIVFFSFQYIIGKYSKHSANNMFIEYFTKQRQPLVQATGLIQNRVYGIIDN